MRNPIGWIRLRIQNSKRKRLRKEKEDIREAERLRKLRVWVTTERSKRG